MRYETCCAHVQARALPAAPQRRIDTHWTFFLRDHIPAFPPIHRAPLLCDPLPTALLPRLRLSDFKIRNADVPILIWHLPHFSREKSTATPYQAKIGADVSPETSPGQVFDLVSGDSCLPHQKPITRVHLFR